MMRRLPVLPAVVAACLASACGSDERDAVERYIARANAVQERFAPQFRRANESYARFSKGELDTVRSDIEITAAEQSMRDARAQLARLEPPKVAAPLHRRLLRIYELSAEFASESTKLARYLPAARETLGPLGAVGARLRTALRATEAPSAQAAALDRYARTVSARYRRLRTLDPPPVLLATHRSQLLRLSESSALARRLGAATRRRDSRRVARLIVRFRDVARRTGDGAALTRSAVGDYNERYRAITRAAAAVRHEQARLGRRYG
jgi:hypothetical protein